MKVLIHASLDFKEEMINARDYIQSHSKHSVVLPELTRYQDIRDKLGDDVTFTKIKNRLTLENFANVETCDVLLIINPSHRDIDNYVGGNAFMEMVIAYYLKKPIFLTNEIPEGMSYTEEMKTFYPIVVGDYDTFLSKLDELDVD